MPKWRALISDFRFCFLLTCNIRSFIPNLLENEMGTAPLPTSGALAPAPTIFFKIKRLFRSTSKFKKERHSNCHAAPLKKERLSTCRSFIAVVVLIQQSAYFALSALTKELRFKTDLFNCEQEEIIYHTQHMS